MADDENSYFDVRLSRTYDGSADPSWQLDTLLNKATELARDARAYGPYCTEWSNILDPLRLHPSSSSEEVTTRALKVLEGAADGSASVREVQAVSCMLGRDRESRRMTGSTPMEAILDAFEKEFVTVSALKAAGKSGEWDAAA